MIPHSVTATKNVTKVLHFENPHHHFISLLSLEKHVLTKPNIQTRTQDCLIAHESPREKNSIFMNHHEKKKKNKIFMTF